MADRTLLVRLHGETIGTLTRERSGKVTFDIDREWMNRDNRPVLSVAFEEAGEKMARRLYVSGTGLPPFFENLLPEGESRVLISGLNGVKTSDGFGLLERTGRSLFGAVEVISMAPTAPASGVEVLDEPSSTVSVDFSLAGVQQKMLLSRVADRLTVRSESHIVKIPDMVHSGLVRNEFAIMRLAKAAGLDVAEVEIASLRFPRDNPNFADMPEVMEVLAVERFDRRPDGRKVHAEEVHQMFGELVPSRKYDLKAEAVGLRLADSGVDPRAFLKQVAFHAIVGNGDAHAKNFAVLYPDGRTACLSPMYDAVSTVVYGRDDSYALSLGGKRLWREVDMRAFEAFGSKVGIEPAEARRIVSSTIDTVLGAWPEVSEEFPAHLREPIERHFRSGLALTRDYIAANGFPPPLPRTPNHPIDTHHASRSAAAVVVRRRDDGVVDNPLDVAIARRSGEEVHVRDGKIAVPDMDAPRPRQP